MSPSPSTAARRKRATGEETVGVHFAMPPQVRQRANDVARSLGITLGRYMEILVLRDVLDEHGRPRWAQPGQDLARTMPALTEQDASAW